MRVVHHTSVYVEGQATKASTPAEDEYDTRYAVAFRRAASEPPERRQTRHQPRHCQNGIKGRHAATNAGSHHPACRPTELAL